MTIRSAHAEKSTLGVLDGIRAVQPNTVDVSLMTEKETTSRSRRRRSS